MTERIGVNPEPEDHKYYIEIGSGLHNRFAQYLQEYYPSGKVFLVSDENVYSLYGDKLNFMLQESGYEVIKYVVPAGEASKSNRYLQEGYNKLINNNFARNNFVIAFGGGVVGDLAGYLAATYMRGLPVIQIPTTLLAQVDSSVGGKTAINHPKGKNLIGSFYQPVFVMIDIDFLQTLPQRELKSGMAEVIKYGLIDDMEFFKFLTKNKDNVYRLKQHIILKIIKNCCQIKSDIVNVDQKEKGKRVILNFGHTIGHGLEAGKGYNGLKHGEAVAIGMIGAAELSYRLGYLKENELRQIKEVISNYNFTVNINIDPDEILKIMQHDKKVKDNKLRWVLLNSIGDTIIEEDIDEELVKEVLGVLNCIK